MNLYQWTPQLDHCTFTILVWNKRSRFHPSTAMTYLLDPKGLQPNIFLEINNASKISAQDCFIIAAVVTVSQSSRLLMYKHIFALTLCKSVDQYTLSHTPKSISDVNSSQLILMWDGSSQMSLLNFRYGNALHSTRLGFYTQRHFWPQQHWLILSLNRITFKTDISL